jgi:hypothetical protein
MMVCAVLASGVLSAADEDPVGKKLAAAKEEYEKATEKARAGLLADLKKKEDAAQKAGDLKTLEKVQAEAKAFEDSSELPKSVPTRIYEGQMRTAKARLEVAYGVAIKQYTKDGKLSVAKAIQQELDEFKKGGHAVTGTPNDPFKVKSVWVGGDQRNPLKFTVTERKGEKFTATYLIGRNLERQVSGTIKDGKVSWLAKDVRVRGGGSGADNYGTLGTDKFGDKIDFVWRNAKGGSGAFTLRLSKAK